MATPAKPRGERVETPKKPLDCLPLHSSHGHDGSEPSPPREAARQRQGVAEEEKEERRACKNAEEGLIDRPTIWTQAF